MNFKKILRYIQDFPETGVTYVDITPVLKDEKSFKAAIDAMLAAVSDLHYELIVGSESRGFIMGTPLAYAANCGFVPVRKPGRLPAETISYDYSLEYGEDSLEIHADAIKPGQKVLIVDDLLATGGTASATCQLVEALGGEVVGTVFFIELTELGGRQALADYRVDSIVQI